MQLPESRVARLVISVDIDPASEESFLWTDLLETLGSHQAPALWCLDLRRPTSLLDQIRSTAPQREFGLLATSQWVGGSRAEFSRELGLRRACAAKARLTITALALADIDPPKHLDLLADHHIGLLRTRSDRRGAAGESRPSLARFGIAAADPTLLVPSVARWSMCWTARSVFRRAIVQGDTIHLVVTSRQLAANPPGGLAALDYLLQIAATYRERGELHVVMPSQLAGAHQERQSPVASRSVLRAA